jgi:hypothetical protein
MQSNRIDPSILREDALLLLLFCAISQVLLTNWARILVLEPKEDALLMVNMFALQLNHHFPHFHFVLADWAMLSGLLHPPVGEPFDLLLAESLGNLADLVSQFKQLLNVKLVTS